MTPSLGPTDSAQVRGQLVTSLELELIGPTQRVLKALAAAGQGLEREALDRLPSSWYFTGFLVPTTTDLSLRCDDTADDDLAGVDGVDQRRPRSKDKAYKSGGAGDDGGPSDGGPAKPQFQPSSIGVSVFLPPGGELELIARWGDDTRVTEPSNSDPSAGSGSSREEPIWQGTPRQEALALSHQEISSATGLASPAGGTGPLDVKRRNGTYNTKRQLADLRYWPQDRLEQLGQRLRYGGNPEHKRNPGDFGLTPPSGARIGKMLCDEVGIFHRQEALELLRSGVAAGLISERCVNGWPQNIWALRDGRVLEAQLEP